MQKNSVLICINRIFEITQIISASVNKEILLHLSEPAHVCEGCGEIIIHLI